MSDVTGLKAAVLAQSEEKGRLNLRAAQEKIQADFEKQKDQLVLEKEAQRRQRLQAIQSSKQQELQLLTNQVRQSSLASKQELLKDLFTEAQVQMENWSQEKELAFLKTILESYDRPLDLHLGQLTAIKLSKEARVTLEQTYPYVTISDEEVVGQAGFVISQGKVDDNYLYGQLLADFWEAQGYQIASEIFKN